MKTFSFCILCFFSFYSIRAQSTEEILTEVSNASVFNPDWENNTSETAETEISLLQELNQTDINSDDMNDLMNAGLMSEWEYQNLIRYRQLVGDMMDMYELQAIPGWTVEMIKKILPFVCLKRKYTFVNLLKSNLRFFSSRLLLSSRINLPNSEGYFVDTATHEKSFLGSPVGLTLRYECKSSRNFSFGLLMEKDPGEKLWGTGRFKGPDFLSGHLSYKDTGLLKLLLLGDYVVNFGQGLICWQSMAGHKGAQVMNVKREGQVFKSYRSFVENDMHRGLALVLAKRSWETSFFVSSYRIDARVIEDNLDGRPYVSYFPETGLHRTESELLNKKDVSKNIAGLRLQKKFPDIKWGINVLVQKLDIPVQKSSDAYRYYSFSGTHYSNYSIDYSFSLAGFHFFGEAAGNGNGGFAAVNAVMVPISSKTDFCLYQRYFSRKFFAFKSDVFSSSEVKSGESGIYLGLSSRPSKKWEVGGFLDMCRNAWIGYLRDYPTENLSGMIRSRYNFNKQSFIQIKIQTNRTGNDLSRSLRSQYKPYFIQSSLLSIENQSAIGKNSSLRAVICLKKYQVGFQKPSFGILQAADINLQSKNSRMKLQIRVLFFDTDDYYTRIYTFENDLKYSYYYPTFFGKGSRGCISLEYKISRNVNFSLKAAVTRYDDKKYIGSGADMINNNFSGTLKSQLVIEL